MFYRLSIRQQQLITSDWYLHNVPYHKNFQLKKLKTLYLTQIYHLPIPNTVRNTTDESFEFPFLIATISINTFFSLSDTTYSRIYDYVSYPAILLTVSYPYLLPYLCLPIPLVTAFFTICYLCLVKSFGMLPTILLSLYYADSDLNTQNEKKSLSPQRNWCLTLGQSHYALQLWQLWVRNSNQLF